MNAPYAITTVAVNENVKKIIKPKERKFTFLSYFMCAGTAGAVASIVTCPMDNIKTRIQTQISPTKCEKMEEFVKENTKSPLKAVVDDCKTGSRPILYKNILGTMRSIYSEEGFIKGFFKGASPRMLSNAPSCAISWLTYELIKHAMGC